MQIFKDIQIDKPVHQAIKTNFEIKDHHHVSMDLWANYIHYLLKASLQYYASHFKTTCGMLTHIK